MEVIEGVRIVTYGPDTTGPISKPLKGLVAVGTSVCVCVCVWRGCGANGSGMAEDE